MSLVSQTKRKLAVVKDITFETPSGRVDAYLVVPTGTVKAGLVLLHGFGPGLSRREFLSEAVALAKYGVESIVPAGSFPWQESPTGLAHDRKLVVRQVIELRRAIDLLRSQIHATRFAVVGHDFGATYAADLAGADRRARAYVVIAGTTTFPDWFAIVNPGVDTPAYRRGFVDLNPITWIQKAAPARTLFQFGRDDNFVSRSTATSFYRAAIGPKQLRFYRAGHDLNTAARTYRSRWFRAQLAIP